MTDSLLTKAQRIVAKHSFGHWPFPVELSFGHDATSDGYLFTLVMQDLPDAVTGQKTSVDYTQYIPRPLLNAARDELESFIKDLVASSFRRALDHEALEHIHYNGVRYLDPHRGEV